MRFVLELTQIAPANVGAGLETSRLHEAAVEIVRASCCGENTVLQPAMLVEPSRLLSFDAHLPYSASWLSPIPGRSPFTRHVAHVTDPNAVVEVCSFMEAFDDEKQELGDKYLRTFVAEALKLTQREPSLFQRLVLPLALGLAHNLPSPENCSPSVSEAITEIWSFICRTW